MAIEPNRAKSWAIAGTTLLVVAAGFLAGLLLKRVIDSDVWTWAIAGTAAVGVLLLAYARITQGDAQPGRYISQRRFEELLGDYLDQRFGVWWRTLAVVVAGISAVLVFLFGIRVSDTGKILTEHDKVRQRMLYVADASLQSIADSIGPLASVSEQIRLAKTDATVRTALGIGQLEAIRKYHQLEILRAGILARAQTVLVEQLDRSLTSEPSIEADESLREFAAQAGNRSELASACLNEDSADRVLPEHNILIAEAALSLVFWEYLDREDQLNDAILQCAGERLIAAAMAVDDGPKRGRPLDLERHRKLLYAMLHETVGRYVTAAAIACRDSAPTAVCALAARVSEESQRRMNPGLPGVGPVILDGETPNLEMALLHLERAEHLVAGLEGERVFKARIHHDIGRAYYKLEGPDPWVHARQSWLEAIALSEDAATTLPSLSPAPRSVTRGSAVPNPPTLNNLAWLYIQGDLPRPDAEHQDRLIDALAYSRVALRATPTRTMGDQWVSYADTHLQALAAAGYYYEAETLLRMAVNVVARAGDQRWAASRGEYLCDAYFKGMKSLNDRPLSEGGEAYYEGKLRIQDDGLVRLKLARIKQLKSMIAGRCTTFGSVALDRATDQCLWSRSLELLEGVPLKGALASVLIDSARTHYTDEWGAASPDEESCPPVEIGQRRGGRPAAKTLDEIFVDGLAAPPETFESHTEVLERHFPELDFGQIYGSLNNNAAWVSMLSPEGSLIRPPAPAETLERAKEAAALFGFGDPKTLDTLAWAAVYSVDPADQRLGRAAFQALVCREDETAREGRDAERFEDLMRRYSASGFDRDGCDEVTEKRLRRDGRS